MDKGSAGFLGIGAKPAIIRARKEVTLEDKAVGFLKQVFEAMSLPVEIQVSYNEARTDAGFSAVPCGYGCE